MKLPSPREIIEAVSSFCTEPNVLLHCVLPSVFILMTYISFPLEPNDTVYPAAIKPPDDAACTDVRISDNPPPNILTHDADEFPGVTTESVLVHELNITIAEIIVTRRIITFA